jgi:hypothetical protein
MRLLKEITGVNERCCVSLQSWKKGEAHSWQQPRICGWFREFRWLLGVGVRGNQALLRLYAFWQVKFQECVNDSYNSWSSFICIPCSHQYIPRTECRVRNWMQYFLLCSCSVWKHTVYCLSEQNYLYLDTASCFYRLWPPLGQQYSILKTVKCNTQIYIYSLQGFTLGSVK